MNNVASVQRSASGVGKPVIYHTSRPVFDPEAAISESRFKAAHGEMCKFNDT